MKLIVKGTSPVEEKIIAIFEKTKDKIRIYYGDLGKVFLITEEKFAKLRAKPRSGKYILVKFDPREFKTLKEQYEVTYKEAIYLKELTNGKMNLFKTGSTAKTALQLFYDLCPINDIPEKIDEKETDILLKAKSGALIWGIPYKGFGYKYDFVSEYPSIMISNKLKIPWGKPIYEKMTLEEFNKLEYFKYGIYHVKVLNSDYRLFRENPNDWYTHTDLNYAKNVLKYKLELVEDGEDNAMIYTKLKSIRQVFKPFIDYLFQFKSQGIKLIKKYINALWGKLCQKNIITIKANEKIYDNKVLFSIKPNYKDLIEDHNLENHTLDIYKKSQYYELSFARLGHFVLASGRLKTSNAILPNLDNCVRTHTDGIILKKPIKDVELGSNIGDLKFEEKGNCEIFNSNTYDFKGERHGKKEDLFLFGRENFL